MAPRSSQLKNMEQSILFHVPIRGEWLYCVVSLVNKPVQIMCVLHIPQLYNYHKVWLVKQDLFSRTVWEEYCLLPNTLCIHVTD